MTRVHHAALAAVLVAGAGLANCSCDNLRAPTKPTDTSLPAAPPTQPGPTPAPQPPFPVASDTWTITGTLWAHSLAGRQPAANGIVWRWLDLGSAAFSGGSRASNSAGEFAFAVPKNVVNVLVTGYVARGYYQPCAVAIQPTGDLSADVDMVLDQVLRTGELPSELAGRSPTLSGLIYESTSDGPKPVPDAWVWLDGVSGLGQKVADTISDSGGRYTLCALPDSGKGLLLQVSASGFELAEVSADFAHVKTLNVELRRAARP